MYNKESVKNGFIPATIPTEMEMATKESQYDELDDILSESINIHDTMNQQLPKNDSTQEFIENLEEVVAEGNNNQTSMSNSVDLDAAVLEIVDSEFKPSENAENEIVNENEHTECQNTEQKIIQNQDDSDIIKNKTEVDASKSLDAEDKKSIDSGVGVIGTTPNTSDGHDILVLDATDSNAGLDVQDGVDISDINTMETQNESSGETNQNGSLYVQGSVDNGDITNTVTQNESLGENNTNGNVAKQNRSESASSKVSVHNKDAVQVPENDNTHSGQSCEVTNSENEQVEDHKQDVLQSSSDAKDGEKINQFQIVMGFGELHVFYYIIRMVMQSIYNIRKVKVFTIYILVHNYKDKFI